MIVKLRPGILLSGFQLFCIILCHSLQLFLYDLFLYPKCFIFGYAGFTVMLLVISLEPDRITLFILMDFPIHIDTISVGLSTSFLKGSQVKISKL